MGKVMVDRKNDPGYRSTSIHLPADVFTAFRQRVIALESTNSKVVEELIKQWLAGKVKIDDL
jgi:hypothetical protein